jgi:hypothetical protein
MDKDDLVIGIQALKVAPRVGKTVAQHLSSIPRFSILPPTSNTLAPMT